MPPLPDLAALLTLLNGANLTLDADAARPFARFVPCVHRSSHRRGVVELGIIYLGRLPDSMDSILMLREMGLKPSAGTGLPHYDQRGVRADDIAKIPAAAVQHPNGAHDGNVQAACDKLPPAVGTERKPACILKTYRPEFPAYTISDALLLDGSGVCRCIRRQRRAPLIPIARP